MRFTWPRRTFSNGARMKSDKIREKYNFFFISAHNKKKINVWENRIKLLYIYNYKNDLMCERKKKRNVHSNSVTHDQLLDCTVCIVYTIFKFQYKLISYFWIVLPRCDLTNKEKDYIWEKMSCSNACKKLYRFAPLRIQNKSILSVNKSKRLTKMNSFEKNGENISHW